MRIPKRVGELEELPGEHYHPGLKVGKLLSRDVSQLVSLGLCPAVPVTAQSVVTVDVARRRELA